MVSDTRVCDTKMKNKNRINYIQVSTSKMRYMITLVEHVKNTRWDAIPSSSYHKMLEKPNMLMDIIRREAYGMIHPGFLNNCKNLWTLATNQFSIPYCQSNNKKAMRYSPTNHNQVT